MNLTRSKRRSKVDLYYYILKNCVNRKNITRSQINYDLCISFAQLNEYILSLEKLGLLEIDRDKIVFRITPRGLEFVKSYDELISFVPKLLEDTA
ncbi:MAG: winged helix-turn-helix domain-containing protein [Thermoproteota archaeon]|nr:winged helix-turn-helix domain-containing protein [Thermoproteota archaeon]